MTEPVPPTLLILGATSAVAHAYARLRLSQGPVRLILAGRNGAALEDIRSDLLARGAADVVVVAGEIGDPDSVPALFEEVLKATPQLDEVLLAYGLLGEQVSQQASPSVLTEALNVNFLSAAIWSECVAARFEQQGHGRLAIIGSVAGDRGRQSNYIYGAAKAGLERLAEGMAHRFAGTREISVTLVKPGFIKTPMTDHIEGRSGPLWAEPEAVAASIARAVDKRRMRIYTPWFWRWILLIIRAVPVPVMHRTRL